MGKQGKEAKHTVPCTLRNTALAALFSPSLLPKSPSSPLLLRSVPEPQPVVNHKLNVTERVNLPHNQLLHDSPGDFQGGRKQRKRKDEERKETATSCSFALQARHEAKHRQALMRAADIPVGRGTHNNASVSGRELADLFLHVGFGSRDDGSYGRKKNGSSLLSLFWPAKKTTKKTTDEKWRAEADGVRLL